MPAPVDDENQAAAALQAHLPPENVEIPSPPLGADSSGGANYRHVLPCATELAVMDGAVGDLQNSASFDAILGLTGLQQAQVVAAFDAGRKWSAMRRQALAWAAYCLTQEGLAWLAIRNVVRSIGPMFDAAIASRPSLAQTMPGLAAFLAARKVIGRKGAATRQANQEAVARGEPPNHGVVGKRRERVAAKAALEASTKTSKA
jgi:hypothetical protein